MQEYQLSSEAVGILVILCSAQLKTAQPDAHGDFFLSICVRELPWVWTIDRALHYLEDPDALCFQGVCTTTPAKAAPTLLRPIEAQERSGYVKSNRIYVLPAKITDRETCSFDATGLIGSALNMFFSSKKSYADPQLVAALAEKSVLLLLLMAFQDTREDLPNPFRDAIVDWGVAEGEMGCRRNIFNNCLYSCS